MRYKVMTGERFTPDLKKESTPKEKKPYRYKRKPTGEMEVFKMIWKERLHRSEISGEPLGDELQPIFFSHILPKAKNKYPKFKLLKENIILKTPREHDLWEHHKKDIRDLKEWKWVFELEQELKERYKNE